MPAPGGHRSFSGPMLLDFLFVCLPSKRAWPAHRVIAMGRSSYQTVDEAIMSQRGNGMGVI